MPQLTGNLQASPVWQEVVYLEGLNGGFKPIWVPLPKQPFWDAKSTDELAMLEMNLPSTTCGDMTMAASQQSSMPISSPHSYRVPE